jgi:putative ABC transport system permease protein
MVVVGELLDDPNKRVESTPLTYSIVGVIPDEGTPIVYVPFVDVRSMGINRFSQTKVIVKENANLGSVRTTIESAGYGTVSVADTVAQIDTLFANFRLILSILGMVALSVAALGMFNTLTVSLLERTREVGLMKAMGMKSDEVKSLFLTESIIMGLYGGILGLFLGIIFGKVLSVVLSALSIIKGVGFVDISYVPPVFVLVVLLLSVIVGIATGYFPAKRATRISALNALRYE